MNLKNFKKLNKLKIYSNHLNSKDNIKNGFNKK